MTRSRILPDACNLYPANVHDAPSTLRVIGVLHRHDEVDVLEELGEFYLVRHKRPSDGTTVQGWLEKAHVAPIVAPAADASIAASVAFFKDRVRRRIAEQENNARIHPNVFERAIAEARMLAYETVLADAEEILTQPDPKASK